ncbi:MAG TPA: hypothetical protein VE844_19265, partial [Gammaproteobacteria bacterium]|nr:hypothetical protein [Gammaproteobacteria bacterium]
MRCAHEITATIIYRQDAEIVGWVERTRNPASSSVATLGRMLGFSSFIPAYGPDGEERRHGRFALVDAGASGTDNLRKPCLPGSPAKVSALALIVERSVLPHQVDEQPDGEHTPDHTEGHGNPT